MKAMVLWLALSGFVLLSVDILSYSTGLKGWRRFSSTFLIFYMQIIASELVIGIPSLLTRNNLITSNIIISLAILFIASRLHSKKLLSNYSYSVIKSGKSIIKSLKGDYFYLVLLILAVVAVLWVVFIGVIFPAIDFDGNSYHLTTVGYIMQNHSIADVKTSLLWLQGYPKGGELIALWSVIISGKDLVADLIQVPFLFLGIYALYETARRVGADKRSARFASLLFVFIPVVLNQMKTTYVDLMLTALFFTSIAIVVKKKITKMDLFILGISYSLLLSIKFTGFLFIVATLPFLFLGLYYRNNKKIKGQIKLYLSELSIVLAPMIVGLYWYVKNYIVYGSPLYPFGLKIAGFSIFPGRTFQEFASAAVSTMNTLPHGTVSRIWFTWTEQKGWFGCFYNYDANFTGLGPMWLVLFVPAILITSYYAIKNKNYLLMGLLTTFLAIFLLYPENYYSRYTLFIIGIGVVSLGYALTHTKRMTSYIIMFIAIIFALIVMATNVTLCNYPANTIGGQINTIKQHNYKGGAIYRRTIGAAYVFMQNIVRPNETVVYDSSPYFIYPLWKQDFSNKVVFIPANNKYEWYSEIVKQEVRYIFSSNTSKEHKWAKSNQKYKSIYKDNLYEIFKVY